MGYKVDFHIHTYYSDGRMSPTDIVKRAKEQGYDMIAITDHDGTDGVQEAMIAGDALDLQVVPGIEFAAETGDGTGVHILGYHIDIENAHLQEVIAVLLTKRNARNERLLEVLNSQGYSLRMSDLTSGPNQKFVGKPNIARALAAKGYIGSPKEAFSDGGIFASTEMRAIKKEKLPVAEAIQLIKGAGGIAVLAHPIQIRGLGEPGSSEFFAKLEILIKGLKKSGLKGLECYHPDHSHVQALKFVELAEKYHLHITEGSDFHGEDFCLHQA